MTHSPWHYDENCCDLCGSADYDVLLDLNTGRAMRSDRQVVSHDLRKYRCQGCGLVRSGSPIADDTLEQYYSDHYTLAIHNQEHFFYTKQGTLSRSQVLRDWMIDAFGVYRWQRAKQLLEVGAGSGLLLKSFQARFPGLDFQGIEPSAGAVGLAQAEGLPIEQGTTQNLGSRQYDAIYSVAVIEHVASPSQFLYDVHRHLKPGGLLFLCQPTQDVVSYDVFFLDHIHHFGTEHLRGYAKKCGFRELGLVVGHELMPNFSLHLWQAVSPPSTYDWQGEAGFTTCAETAHKILADMAALNEKLRQFSAEQRRTAVFGLSEAYWLILAYSNLLDFPVVCGLDDEPDKPAYNQFAFPVVTPEAAANLHVDDVLLTMNKLYYEQAAARLSRLGMVAHPIFS